MSVYKNLLFVSSEATTGRTDCGIQGVTDTVSAMRARGIRIFDITDIVHPRPITIVQTCRGSHTNTLVTPPNDPDNVYIYVSGSAGVRSSNEMPGCSSGSPDQDPNTALFRIEVIKIPLAHPEQAAIVSSPRIFADAATGAANGLAPVARHAESAADSIAAAQARAKRIARTQRPRVLRCRPSSGRRASPSATTSPSTRRSDWPAVRAADMAFCSTSGTRRTRRGSRRRPTPTCPSGTRRRSTTTAPRFCSPTSGAVARSRAAERRTRWSGARMRSSCSNNGKMTFTSYYKMPAAQTAFENCVAHNGSLIPIPGRDVMAQAFYQGGITVFDWTDARHPKEIAFFDRGPMDSTKLVNAGFWSAYWYNGYIYGSEISRGLDIFELKPSGLLSQNEIDAAKTVHFDFLNVQDQPKLVWPATFVLARAYVDQLVRDNGLAE